MVVLLVDGSASYGAASDIVSRRVGDETVLVDLDGEQYYSLNPTGSLAWELLSAGEPFDRAVDAVVAAYEVERAQARDDLAELVAALVTAGLLRLGDPPDSASPCPDSPTV